MAEKRMFSKKITESDAFIEMPDSTQNLYFHLSMNADDDGFVDKPRAIMRMTGKKEDDFKLLIVKAFIIPFDSGVIVIKHWRINNYLRNDRYTPTTYVEEKRLLSVKGNGAYTLGIPTVDQSDTQYRLDESSIDKSSVDEGSVVSGNNVAAQTLKSTRFTKPTIEEVNSYCIERKNNVSAERFYDFYESKGWRVGKTPMKDWKACVRTWEKSDSKKPQGNMYDIVDNME